MRRVIVIAASSIALAGCSSGSLPSFEMPSFQSAPAASTVEFESEPPGAEVKVSTGQNCRTPCALAVAANEATATFALPGYQSQSVAIKMQESTDGRDPNTGQMPPSRMSPNPVYVELMQAPQIRRPAPTATKPVAKKKPKTTATKPKPPATQEPMTAAPAQAPSSPWPAPSATR